jgi:hypothetical protein
MTPILPERGQEHSLIFRMGVHPEINESCKTEQESQTDRVTP